MDTLAAVADMLGRRADLRLVIAFGSVARNAATQDSDLDVAVLAERPLAADEKLALIEELAAIGGRPVDLLDLYDLHGPVLGRLLREGRVLLRRDSDDLARLILRAVIDEEDFAPYRRRILETRRQAWTAN